MESVKDIIIFGNSQIGREVLSFLGNDNVRVFVTIIYYWQGLKSMESRLWRLCHCRAVRGEQCV